MELRQLAYFLAVIDSGSLSRAATIVGVTQSALSRQISALEEELNVHLFYRHGRGIRLTREGEQFQTVVAPVLRDLRQVASDLREAADVPAGAISLGMPPSISAAIGAEIVAEFARDFPYVRLHVVDGLSGFVNEWLAAGRIDMAVINNARRSAYIRMDYLMTVGLYLFGRRADVDAICADPECIPVARLADLPLILVGRNHGLRRALDDTVRSLGLSLDIQAEVDALTPLIKLVRQGMGFTVLPHGVILPEAHRRDFGYRRMVEPAVHQDYMMAFSLQRPMTHAMRELARRVRAEMHRAIEDGRLVGTIEQGRTALSKPPARA
ncbi:MAG: LysR family transcriptional regulator [Mesorhizobium sp.]